MSRGSFLTLAGIVICVLALCAGQSWLIETPFFLAFGWIGYVASTLPRVRLDPGGIAFFAIALVCATPLAHGLCRWLWQDDVRWRWKWTAIGLATVMLMFVAGMAATGVAHQTGWLFAGREPLVESSYKARLDQTTARCADNLRQIAQALSGYAATNDGYTPIDQADLVRIVASEGGQPDWFVCGDGRFGPKPATRTAGWIEQVSRGEEYFKYRYFPSPIVAPDGRRRVRMCDREIHFYGGYSGFVILYEDGAVECLDGPTARTWLSDRFADNPKF